MNKAVNELKPPMGPNSQAKQGQVLGQIWRERRVPWETGKRVQMGFVRVTVQSFRLPSWG